MPYRRGFSKRKPTLSRKRTSIYKIGKSKRSRYGYSANTITTEHYAARQRRTDYAASLIDPSIKVNARIPDIACYETSTFCNEYHAMGTVRPYSDTTDNNNAVHIWSLHPDGYCSSYNSGAAALGTPGKATAAAARFPAIVPGGLSNSNAFSERYKAARLVSALLKYTFAGDDTKTSGEIFCAFVPEELKNFVTGAQGAVNWDGTGLDGGIPQSKNLNATTIDKVKEYCTSWYQGPLKNGCVLRYKPVDGSSFDMANPVQKFADSVRITGKYGFFIVIFNHENSPGVNFSVDYWANYEGIPSTYAIGINVGVSASDPGALAHGINAAAKTKTCFANTPAAWNTNVTEVLRSVH